MIDVTKCIGCRKGLDLFTKEGDKYHHVDLFASPEAGAIYECQNSDVIGDYLKLNKDRGTYLPKDEETAEFFRDQEMWWEDIITMAYRVYENDSEKVTSFFNTDPDEGVLYMHKRPNELIEATLLAMMDKRGLEVTVNEYPDLLKWKNVQPNPKTDAEISNPQGEEESL